MRKNITYHRQTDAKLAPIASVTDFEGFEYSPPDGDSAD